MLEIQIITIDSVCRFVGGASAHLHILSKESGIYINNAILVSGTALTEWAMNNKNDHLSIAYELAADFGHGNCTFNELIQFLKSIPAEKIASIGGKLSTWFPVMDFELAPVIESIYFNSQRIRKKFYTNFRNEFVF